MDISGLPEGQGDEDINIWHMEPEELFSWNGFPELDLRGLVNKIRSRCRRLSAKHGTLGRHASYNPARSHAPDLASKGLVAWQAESPTAANWHIQHARQTHLLQVNALCNKVMRACLQPERQTGILQHDEVRVADIDCVMLAWFLDCLTWSEKLCGSLGSHPPMNNLFEESLCCFHGSCNMLSLSGRPKNGACRRMCHTQGNQCRIW